jgi:hypothetical protein
MNHKKQKRVGKKANKYKKIIIISDMKINKNEEE